MKPQDVKIKTAKFLTLNILTRQILNGYDPNHVEGESRIVQVQSMAMYRYFKPSDSFPDPSRPLSASVSSAVIKEANKAVRSATHGSNQAW